MRNGAVTSNKFYFQAYRTNVFKNEIYWGFTPKVVIRKTNFGTDCQLHCPLYNKLEFNLISSKNGSTEIKLICQLIYTSWLHRASNNVETFLLPTDAHNVKKHRVIKTF